MSSPARSSLSDGGHGVTYPKALRTAVLGLALITVALALMGCGSIGDRPDFTFINGAEPDTIDPAKATGQPGIRIINAIFEGLTARNAKGEVIPGVAERWDITEEAKVYTFHLRHDAKWSNGEPVTAYDFEASWKRTLDPAFGSQYVYQLYYIKNAKAYNQGEIADWADVGVKALDARTLRVDLENSTPFFLELTAFATLYPVPVKVLQRLADKGVSEGLWVLPEHIVSNGPYILAEWRVNDLFRLKANTHYWNDKETRMRVIDALAIDNANTAFNMFYSGKADLLLDKGLIPSLILDQLKDKPYFHANPFLGTFFYRFNVTEKPFDDVRVRKAFTMALDKTRIVEKITRAGEQPAGSFTPPGISGYTPPAGLPYDPDSARQLLAEAGYPEGKGFPRVVLLYNTSEQSKQIAVETQAIWEKELGVRVELRNQEWKVYLDSMTKLEYNIARSSWIGDYNDPNTFVDCFVSGSGNNRTGWSNSQFDELVAEAARTTDPAARFEILRRAETIFIEEECIMAPIYFYVGISLFHPDKLGGFVPNVIDDHPLNQLYWKEPK